MARLVGVDLPRDKRIEVGGTYIPAWPHDLKKIAETSVPGRPREGPLEEDLGKLRDYIQENLTVEGDLHREVSQNVKRLMGKSAATVAFVTRKGLPVRGQAYPHQCTHPQGPA